MNRTCPFLLAIVISILFAIPVAGQQSTKPVQDTNYYVTYRDMLTTRVYMSKKYTSLLLKGNNGSKTLQYLPNTPTNVGIGVTYGWFTLNLGTGIGSLKPDIASKGKTKYLDLQAHIYAPKFNVDVLAEFYKGYYLHPAGKAVQNGEEWYQRPDLKVMNLGVAGYKILNWQKFSFRAAMLQNEWQKQSAGSLLIGAEVYYGKTRGDSTIVPSMLQNDYDQYGVNSMQYFNIGPGAGYAYTLVVAKHFYILGSATASLPISFNQETRSEDKASRTSVTPNLSYKASAGYNSSKWAVNALWVNNGLNTKGESGMYKFNTGNIRVNLVYRIATPNKLKKPLRIFAMDK